MHKASPEESAALKVFLQQSYEADCKKAEATLPNQDVTALMYFFWPKECAAEKWPMFEGSIKETWRNCGFLRTVLVVNELHDCLKDFVAQYLNVEVQVEPRLKPGEINTMSIDCNARLYTRFSTKYVLIVQDDGFPLRPGLDEFVRKGYDFIGSPYCRPLLIPNLLTNLLSYCPSNGGFSLRSRRICQLAAEYWERTYKNRSFVVNEMSEDLFYTDTLPRKHIEFWFKRRQAPSKIAERFSYEGAFPLCSKIMPLGFHTATGFSILQKAFRR